MSLWHTLSDGSDRLDLLSEVHNVQRAAVHTARAGEVHNDIGIRVFLDGLFDAGVNRQKGLLHSPVNFLDMVATEGVDHSSDGRCLATTRVVEVEHALSGTGLEAVHQAACLRIERLEPQPCSSALPIWEVYDVVVGLCALTARMDRANGVVSGRDTADDLSARRAGQGVPGVEGGMDCALLMPDFKLRAIFTPRTMGTIS